MEKEEYSHQQPVHEVEDQPPPLARIPLGSRWKWWSNWRNFVVQNKYKLRKKESREDQKSEEDFAVDQTDEVTWIYSRKYHHAFMRKRGRNFNTNNMEQQKPDVNCREALVAFKQDSDIVSCLLYPFLKTLAQLVTQFFSLWQLGSAGIEIAVVRWLQLQWCCDLTPFWIS